jgi:hypothetical protein
MKVLKLFTIVLCLSVISISCSGDDGEDGAMGLQGIQGDQGNQGDQGDQGNQGDQGDTGDTGDTGTANVIYSDWIETDFLLPGAQDNNLQGIGTFTPSELNIDQDVVLVYGRRVGGDPFFEGIYALPYFFSSQNEYYGFVFTEGGSGNFSLQVRVHTTDGGTNLFTFFNHFRYVIIPGGVSGKSTSNTNNSLIDDYTKLSYNEIIELLNIPE